MGLRVFRADRNDDDERHAGAGNVSAWLYAWWRPSPRVGTEVLDETTTRDGKVAVWPWAGSAWRRVYAVWLSLMRLITSPDSLAIRGCVRTERNGASNSLDRDRNCFVFNLPARS